MSLGCHTIILRFFCSGCESILTPIFFRYNLLTEKMVDRKGKESYYKCLTCKECFDDLREVKFHQHQPTCKYFCERCRRQLDTKLAIVMHVIEHNMDDEPEPEYECEQCFLEFYNLDEYEQHQNSCTVPVLYHTFSVTV